MVEYKTAKHPIPVIVGVDEIKNASRRREDAIKPLELMLQAIHAAATDAIGAEKANLIRHLDGVSVVASSTWPYTDLPGLISQNLGIRPKHTAYSALSGNSPVQLIDDAAQLIAQGRLEAVAIVGGEALASLKEFIKAGSFPPPWAGPGTTLDKIYYANNVQMLHGLGKLHEVGVPMQVYAMYENGLRAHRGQTIAQNHLESARLYGKYAQIAAGNPMAWTFGKQEETETTIGLVNTRNRMICFPYPLLMNAFNDVNLAAACIVTSQEFAERVGIPQAKWIFSLGGGRGHDSDDCRPSLAPREVDDSNADCIRVWHRANFHSSPAMDKALNTSLTRSGLQADDIDLFDFYSCFPVVPKLACQLLGISIEEPSKPITLLGGLTSFGGAGANYSMHAVAEMVRRLRAHRNSSRNGKNGLILANGGVLTLETLDIMELRSINRVVVLPTGSGEATVETYTVEYDRQNKPILGHIVCRLKADGSRVIANHANSTTLRQLASRDEEQIGRVGFVEPSHKPGRNLFSYRTSAL